MRFGVVLVSEPRSVLSWSWKQSLSIQSRCSCSLAARISSPLKISFKEARTLECAPCSKSPTSKAKRQCYGVKFRLPIPEYKTFTSCHWMFRISRSGQQVYPWHMTRRILSEAWTDYGSGQVGSCHPQRSPAGDCCSSSYVWLHIYIGFSGYKNFNDVVG